MNLKMRLLRLLTAIAVVCALVLAVSAEMMIPRGPPSPSQHPPTQAQECPAIDEPKEQTSTTGCTSYLTNRVMKTPACFAFGNSDGDFAAV